MAIVAGTTSLGALLLEQGEVAFGPVELRTAERAAQITALLNLKQEAMIEAEKRVRGDLLADLLSNSPAAGPTSPPGPAHRASGSVTCDPSSWSACRPNSAVTPSSPCARSAASSARMPSMSWPSRPIPTRAPRARTSTRR